MRLLRFLSNFLTVPISALIGLWVGGQMRSLLTGQKVYTLYYEFQDEQGHLLRNIPVSTKFYPALLFSLIGKPRWIFALIGGLLAGAFIDDRFERLWVSWFVTNVLKIHPPSAGGSA